MSLSVKLFTTLIIYLRVNVLSGWRVTKHCFCLLICSFFFFAASLVLFCILIILDIVDCKIRLSVVRVNKMFVRGGVRDLTSTKDIT